MAIFSADRENFSPTTTNSDLGITEVSPTVCRIIEVMVSGTASSSAVNRQGIVRSTAVGVTPAAITLALFNPRSQAVAAGAESSFTTPPTYSTLTAINAGLNAFGGIIRWVCAPGEEFYLIGATAANSEASLTAKNGATAGTQSAHIVIEEF